MYRKLTAISVLFLFLLAFVAGCPALYGVEDSPVLKQKKSYMQARKEFAMTLEKYNDYSSKAMAEQQVKWKVTIDPLFRTADQGLDAWKLAIDDNISPGAQEQLYLSLKSKLFFYLVEVFGVEEE